MGAHGYLHDAAFFAKNGSRIWVGEERAEQELLQNNLRSLQIWLRIDPKLFFFDLTAYVARTISHKENSLHSTDIDR